MDGGAAAAAVAGRGSQRRLAASTVASARLPRAERTCIAPLRGATPLGRSAEDTRGLPPVLLQGALLESAGVTPSRTERSARVRRRAPLPATRPPPTHAPLVGRMPGVALRAALPPSTQAPLRSQARRRVCLRCPRAAASPLLRQLRLCSLDDAARQPSGRSCSSAGSGRVLRRVHASAPGPEDPRGPIPPQDVAAEAKASQKRPISVGKDGRHMRRRLANSTLLPLGKVYWRPPLLVERNPYVRATTSPGCPLPALARSDARILRAARRCVRRQLPEGRRHNRQVTRVSDSLNEEGLQNPIDVWCASPVQPAACGEPAHSALRSTCAGPRASTSPREHRGRYLVTSRRCKRLEALVFSDAVEVNVRVMGRKPDTVPTSKYEAFELTKAKFQSRAGQCPCPSPVLPCP
eukprot:scaffold624_cov402-Prasinococcus_capsulatus_cf.AAC.78